MAAQRKVFAVGRGQYENIGDIILRRPLLDWVRESGQLHVYVGRSPPGYDEGLGLGVADVVYRSFWKWYFALLISALRGTASSVYKPGEIQLTLSGMKEHVVMIPAAALVRLRGGTVSRVGVGARSFSPLPRAIMWPSNALSNYTRWRDHCTAAYLGFGPAIPDLGFGEGLDDSEIVDAMADTSTRNLLVVSMREDTEVAPRPYPDMAWFDGIKSFAESAGLLIWVATQVSVDNDRSRRLASDLGAQLLEWPELSNHRAQEAELRKLYRRALVVASDRLHVIIAAFTEGAAPVGLQLDDSDKVSRHFSTIGIHDISLNTQGISAQQISSSLAMIANRRKPMLERLLEARFRLQQVRAELIGVITSGKPV